MLHAEFSLELSWSICVSQDSVLSKLRPKKVCTTSIIDGITFITTVCINCKFRFCHKLDVVSFTKVLY